MSTPLPLDDDLQDPANSPTLGPAMGLLSAGGPSRMPVSLGQALAEGIQTGQQYGARGRESAYEYMRFLMALQRLQQRAGPQQTPPGAHA